MKHLKSFLNIEPGEEAPVFLLFIYLTLALASFTIARAVRDSLFLNHYDAMDLPYAYIAVAVFIGLLVSVYVKLSNRIKHSVLISGTLLFFICNVFVLWWLIHIQWVAVAFIFYIWASIFGIIITAQVWTLASMTLNTRQARRLFPLIGSGGILGGFLGGLLAVRIVEYTGTGNLLFLLVLFPAVCIGIVQVLTKRFCRLCIEDRSLSSGEMKSQRHSLRKLLHMAGNTRYLRLIMGLLILSSVATIIVDFQFKTAVQDSFETADSLTIFFGSFYAWIGFFSFLLQIFAGRWIIDNFGIRITLLALPIALLSGTAILLAFPLRLWAGLLLKGSDGVIRYSIDKSTIELLYMPIPDDIKAEIKAILDMVVQRIADGVGGLLLLLLTRALGLGIVGAGIVNTAILAAWIWTAHQARKAYIVTLRTNLEERRIIPEFALKAAFRDKDSLEKISSMLSEPDEEVVTYAMNLAVAIGHTDLIPANLIRHPSNVVRYKALDIVSMKEEEYQIRLREEPDAAIRAKMLSRGCSSASAEGTSQNPEEHLHSPDIRIRLAAVACIANSIPPNDIDKVHSYLQDAIGKLEQDADEWHHIAEMIGEINHPAIIQLHIKLMNHPDRAIRKKAILAAGRSSHRELVPVLIQLLASRGSSRFARKALQQYNTTILDTLTDIFNVSEENIEIRRQIPLILSNFPNQSTVDILIGALSNEDGILSYRSIKALNRLRINGQSFYFNPDVISEYIANESQKTLWYKHILRLLYSGNESPDLLAQLLNDKIRQGRERVFRLLGLIMPPATAHAAHKAIVEENISKKANALEYLDNVLSPQLKKWIMPLVETGILHFKDTISEVLEKFVQSNDIALRECTLDAISKNRWPTVEAYI